MKNLPLPSENSRYGFYYYPDTDHYREIDLQAWLPHLKALNASWLTLVAPIDRAIPEYFLRGLLLQGIEPVLHMPVPVEPPPPLQDLRLLFQTYAKWGVHYVSIFDRPNQRSSWPPTGWAQNNLVERFLDIYLPIAEAALQAGLIPVMPPLEPGGDYWDTAFLRASLLSIRRRGFNHLLDKLVLGAYAWTWGHPLNWGCGGPERWPAARPYITPPGSEDQIGFRIFDWYLAIAKAVTENPCQIMILGGGARIGEKSFQNLPAVDAKAHAEANMQIASMMIGKPEMQLTSPELEPIPGEVLTCNFWLLSSASSSPFAQQAWFPHEGEPVPAVSELKQFVHKNEPTEVTSPAFPTEKRSTSNVNSGANKPLAQYLLLPVYEWGISDWHLDVIQPYVKKHRPTIGFSIQEAKQAALVTVVGGGQSFPEAVIDELRQAGCNVRQILGDGTNIATLLARL